jgi:hypothetical protein
MKNNFYKILVALVVFALTACQAATPETPAVEFFKDQPERALSVRPPKGWEAKPGGTGASPSVIVTDDWKGYSSTNTRAVGIVIVPLTDKGTSEQVLQIALGRLKTMLTTQIGKVTLEEVADQSYASVEYQGRSAEKENTPAYYFLAIITKGQRSVLVFAAVDVDQEARVRPAYQSTLKAITLH